MDIYSRWVTGALLIMAGIGLGVETVSFIILWVGHRV